MEELVFNKLLVMVVRVVALVKMVVLKEQEMQVDIHLLKDMMVVKHHNKDLRELLVVEEQVKLVQMEELVNFVARVVMDYLLLLLVLL